MEGVLGENQCTAASESEEGLRELYSIELDEERTGWVEHMTKIEFLDKLDLLLSDLPDEERMNAVWYYEDYFAEAGEANEEAVLAEIGSPEVVAQGIRSACFDKQPAEEAERYHEQTQSAGQHSYDGGNTQYSYRETNRSDYRASGYNQGHTEAGAYRNGQNGEPGRQGGGNLALIIVIFLICFFAFPVVMPIVLVMFALAGGVILAGIALGSVAVAGMTVNTGLGMLLLGIALIVAAIGILFLTIAICGFRVIPAVIRGIVGLIRRLLGKGGTHREKIY